MKIGMVTAVYKPIVNGVTHMISLYKRQLEALGHDVTIFTLGDPDPAGDEPGVIRSPAIGLGNGYYVSMRYTSEAQNCLREMDILHCHHLFMSVDMAHRYAHCPVVYTNHTRYDIYTGNYISLPQPAADAIMRQVWPEYTDRADVVITPSESVRQVMIDFGVRCPIEVIPNGIDLRPFLAPTVTHGRSDLDISPTAVVTAYVGRLSVEKNLPILLKQFAVAHDLVPDLCLLLVGDGPEAAELARLARSLGVEGSVRFAGAVPYADIPGLLSIADFFVTASVSEVHPLTVIEAMASGLPIAGTRSPGIVDSVASGTTGFLTGDPERGLAAAMVALATNPERRAAMGRAAREASRPYDIRETVQMTLALYERLRDERPDLKREREHGRRFRERQRLQPLLDQLSRLLRPPNAMISASRELLSQGTRYRD